MFCGFLSKYSNLLSIFILSTNTLYILHSYKYIYKQESLSAAERGRLLLISGMQKKITLAKVYINQPTR